MWRPGPSPHFVGDAVVASQPATVLLLILNKSHRVYSIDVLVTSHIACIGTLLCRIIAWGQVSQVKPYLVLILLLSQGNNKQNLARAVLWHPRLEWLSQKFLWVAIILIMSRIFFFRICHGFCYNIFGSVCLSVGQRSHAWAQIHTHLKNLPKISAAKRLNLCDSKHIVTAKGVYITQNSSVANLGNLLCIVWCHSSLVKEDIIWRPLRGGAPFKNAPQDASNYTHLEAHYMYCTCIDIVQLWNTIWKEIELTKCVTYIRLLVHVQHGNNAKKTQRLKRAR